MDSKSLLSACPLWFLLYQEENWPLSCNDDGCFQKTENNLQKGKNTSGTTICVCCPVNCLHELIHVPFRKSMFRFVLSFFLLLYPTARGTVLLVYPSTCLAHSHEKRYLRNIFSSQRFKNIARVSMTWILLPSIPFFDPKNQIQCDPVLFYTNTPLAMIQHGTVTQE